MKISPEKVPFTVRWTWEYLRRNPDFQTFFCRESESLVALRKEYLADPVATNPPKDISISLRRDVGEDDDGRPVVGDELYVIMQREFAPPGVWIKVEEDGRVSAGPVIGGLWYQCPGFDVRDFAKGSMPPRPVLVGNTGLTDSIRAKGYPLGDELDMPVTIKLSRPIDEIILDLRHLRALIMGERDNPAEALVGTALPGVASLRMSDRQRAAGLWLWDQITAGKPLADALRAFFGQKLDLALFGKNSVNEENLRLYHARTIACITAGEVLPLK